MTKRRGWGSAVVPMSCKRSADPTTAALGLLEVLRSKAPQSGSLQRDCVQAGLDLSRALFNSSVLFSSQHKSLHVQTEFPGLQAVPTAP